MDTREIKILAVDDNRDNLTVLAAVMADRLPEVRLMTALNGPRGLELACQEDPDVILLDIIMPGMDGYAVCRKLKADERLQMIPVLFLTALGAGLDCRIQALEVGADGFLSKPFDEIELVAQIRAMVKINAANRLRRMEKERLVAAVAERTRELEREMAEREHLQSQLNQAQKMESVGRLAGGVAHDFNNMLGAILGYTEMALERVDPAHPLHADLLQIRKAAERSADLTRQLLAFARKQTIMPKVLNLNETVGGMIKILRRLIGEEVELVWQPGAEIWPVRMDPSQIDQILANLCVNARDAIVGTGKIVIETGTVVFDQTHCAGHLEFVPGDFVMLSVSDTGCGMDKAIQSKLFEPFFTTKEIGKGTGLGLATVYGIVKQNNGFIDVYSESGLGSAFKIYLPRHIGKAVQARKESAENPTRHGHETVLLVEDEPTILKMGTSMLERLGYQVVAAATPGEALRLAEKRLGEIHLLMTDVVMPEMDGRSLAKKLLTLYPTIKSLFMSGYTANVIAHHGVLDEGVQFIQKPFSMKELASKLREVLAQEEEAG